jgi:HTH-type transcriptional regulator, competence development regulator
MKTILGSFLRKLRLQQGEKLKDMAENLNVSSAFLSAVENGKKKMPDSWYEKLASLYHLSPDQQKDLQTAVIESGETVELNIKNISSGNRELAICFARHFDTLDEETSKQIFALLKRKEEEN